jgi:hypothetical protein
MMFRLAALSVAIGSFVSAAGPSFGGPVSGYLRDSRTGAIRPVNGFPGASVIGTALDIPPLRTAIVRADRDMVAGIGEDGSALILVSGLSRQPSWQAYGSLLSGAVGIALDNKGTRLAAWSKERLVVITGVPAEPAVSASLDITALGEVVRAAVSETAVLAAVSAGSEELRLYYIPYSAGSFGDPVPAVTLRSASSVLFDDSGTNAWIADREADSVVAVANVDDSREVSMLLTARDGVSKPAALCQAGGRLVIANAGDSTALLMDTASRDVKTVPLFPSPTLCQRLGDRDLIAMNEAGAQPVSLIQVEQGTSWFVPADVP